MARGRMLSTSISLSEQMADLASDTHRLLATWMLAHLDATGRCTGSPRQLCALVTPLLGVDCGAWQAALDDMARVGLVQCYQDSAGRAVVQWPRFAEHQTGLRPDREAPSRFGDPPDPDRRREEKRSEVKRARACASGPTPEDSGPTPEYDRTDRESYKALGAALAAIWPEIREDAGGLASEWLDAYPGLAFVQLAKEARAKARANGGKVDRPAALLGKWFQRAWHEKRSQTDAAFLAEHAERKRKDAAEARLEKQLAGPPDARPIGADVQRLMAAVRGAK